MKEPQYWHGGVPGLGPGDRILPPTITGEATLLHTSQTLDPLNTTQRGDKVYVATDREDARIYAAAYPNGALYRVKPDEPLEPDPDCNIPDRSWMTSGATVVSVYDRCVRATPKEIRRGVRHASRITKEPHHA